MQRVTRIISSCIISLALICTPVVYADSRETAVTSQVADLGSTVIGLTLGAAEANPLGLGLVLTKGIVYQHIKELPELEQPKAWRTWEAFGWGATANNACVILVILTAGSASPCLLLGATTGILQYNNSLNKQYKEEFDVLCKEAQIKNPDLQCIYNVPTGSLH